MVEKNVKSVAFKPTLCTPSRRYSNTPVMTTHVTEGSQSVDENCGSKIGNATCHHSSLRHLSFSFSTKHFSLYESSTLLLLHQRFYDLSPWFLSTQFFLSIGWQAYVWSQTTTSAGTAFPALIFLYCLQQRTLYTKWRLSYPSKCSRENAPLITKPDAIRAFRQNGGDSYWRIKMHAKMR